MSAPGSAAAERPASGIARMLLQRDLEIKELKEKVEQLQAANIPQQVQVPPPLDPALLATIEQLQREKAELLADLAEARAVVVAPPLTLETMDACTNTDPHCDEVPLSPTRVSPVEAQETEESLRAWVLSNSSAQSTRISQLEAELLEKTTAAEQFQWQCQLGLAAIQERDYALVQYHAALQQRDAALAALQQPLDVSSVQLEELACLRNRVISLSSELAAQLTHNEDLSSIVTQLMQRLEQLVADREQLAEQLRFMTKPHLFPTPVGEHTLEDWRGPVPNDSLQRPIEGTPPRHAHDPAVQLIGGTERLDQHATCSSVSEVSSTDTDHEQPLVRRGWFGWITNTVFPDPI